MAKAFAFLVLLLISPAAYAATTHTVGETSGWTTGVDYGSWGSMQNFAVGDTLLFNYDAMTHAVYEVNQDQYNNCQRGDDDDDNPINVFSSSPTSIALSSPGTRYFVCPRSNHCSLGVKLTVTVGGGSATPAGAPPPTTTPSPIPVTPATPVTPAVPETPAIPATPSARPPPAIGARNCTTHVVGGDDGWTTGVNYENWVRGQNFTVCDALLFNFDAVTHAVYEVNQQDYNNCSTGSGDDDDDDDDDDDSHRSNPIGVYTSSPIRIPLSIANTRYFICPRSNNCRHGQKLAVTVAVATNTASPPSRTNGTATTPTAIPGNTPPTPGPLSAPPPPFGGATSTVHGGGVVGGLSLAVAAVVVLMV